MAFFAYVGLIGGLYLPVVLGHAALKTNGTRPPGPLVVGDPTAGGPITLPLERLTTLAWQHLQIPVIDPFQGFGVPLLANQANAVFPPELALHLLWPGNPSLWNVVRILALAWGTYLLCSSLGQRFVASFAAGAVASLAGVAPPNANLGMVNPLAVLPFVLLSLRYALDPSSRHRNTALLGIATSIAFLALSGFPEVLPLLAVVIVVFSAGAMVRFRSLRRLLPSVASAAVGAATGLVGLLPTLAVVANGAGLNGPTSYDSYVPRYWLATVLFPSVVHRAMAGSPQDLGQTVWVLGTPLLLLVVILSVVIVVRDRSARWYGIPCIAFSLYGLAGYVDAFDVLRIFRVFPFDEILMIRFLPFGWWLPWAVLLGLVIGHTHLIRWPVLAVGLGISVVADFLAGRSYERAVLQQHLPSAASATHHAELIAGMLTAGFVGVALIRHRRIRETALLGITLAGCLYYLPTNFFAPTGNTTIDTAVLTGQRASSKPTLGYDLGMVQLPTRTPSVQIFGPLVPRAYAEVLTALVKPTTTTVDQGPLYYAAPTMYFAEPTPAFVAILRDLGTNTIVSRSPLSSSLFGVISRCANGSAPICLERPARARDAGNYLEYRLRGVDPVLAPLAHVSRSRSTAAALRAAVDLAAAHPTGLDRSGFLPVNGGTRVAHGLTVLSARMDTETVSLALRARSAGLVVLRRSYESGMTASVNGKAAPVYPVDGGLWSAVDVGAGRATITLDYLTTAMAAEVLLAALGLASLTVMWCTVLLRRLRSRMR